MGNNSRERKIQKRELAAENAAVREKLGDAGQLKKLEQLGYGECREAVRLRKKLSMTNVGHLTEPPN